MTFGFAPGGAAELAMLQLLGTRSLGNGKVVNARDKGDVFMAEKTTWQGREAERDKARQEGNAENDQNERAKGRSLPEEQKEKERDQSRCR